MQSLNAIILLQMFQGKSLSNVPHKFSGGGFLRYPLVIQHSHGKWPIEIDGLPMKNVVFPWLC